MAKISIDFEMQLTDDTKALVFDDGSIRLVTNGARFIVDELSNFRDEPTHASVTIRRVKVRRSH